MKSEEYSYFDSGNIEKNISGGKIGIGQEPHPFSSRAIIFLATTISQPLYYGWLIKIKH
ncbi:MAG: hypothetical protein V3T17_11295 [Pseudomonadales bacterium]